MRKILIVEDDQLVATVYRKRFKDAGWEVEWASDGVEGIKSVGTSKPDVVLLDLLMPRLDGIEVLKYIRAHPDLKHLPVVVFSNSYMTNLIENAWRAGADQRLLKASTTPQSLFDSIAKAMQKAATRKAMELAPPAPLGPPQRRVAVALAPAAPGAYVEPIRTVPPPGIRPAMVPPVRSLAYPGAKLTVDPEFQAQIRQLFVAGASAKIESVRATALALAQNSTGEVSEQITELFRKVHSLTGNAAVAGCPAIAHHASMFEAFLQELQQKPRFINASTTRTILNGMEFVSLLFQHALDGEPPDLARRTLIVDGDPMSGQAIGLTLEKAGLRTHLAGDPIEAMALGSAENFDLIVAAADLPGMSGFEACAQLQTLPGCSSVPVLFVSSDEQFEAHANPEVLGDNDVIARPFLIVELTLKAMILLETRRFRTHFASAA